jgi:hypothetical protein
VKLGRPGAVANPEGLLDAIGLAEQHSGLR